MRLSNPLPAFVAVSLFGLLGLALASAATVTDGEQLLTVDHYVRVHSTVPAISGQMTQVYVREVVPARHGPCARARATRLFCSYMEQVLQPRSPSTFRIATTAGWVTWLAPGSTYSSMDMTGYGRSTRPAAMNDPCNLSKEQQLTFVPGLLAAPCAPSLSTADDHA